ncbi:hypothetical protein FQN53_004710 [Emmonsiellopsis sp. PD_33]|nr:hypothetical protein FQN53_004710 [Emmonsiellopsis sp. PD_33]
MANEMDRRSHQSDTLSEDFRRKIRFSGSTSSDPISEGPSYFKEVLQRSLSVNTVVSTGSSFAERMNAARYIKGQKYVCIGRGSCGTVWEQPGTEIAYKTSPHHRALWADFHLTNQVHTSFLQVEHLMETAFPGITVPRVPSASHFFTPASPWWDAVESKFPSGEVLKGAHAAMQMHRILPLPSNTREALIQLYFDPKKQGKASADPENIDCLVRVYLGAYGGHIGKGTWRNSLRNFELYLDMANDLNLDVQLITKEMAVSLAIIHWQAKCDGMDAEWVLGSAASKEFLPEIDDDFLNKEMVDIGPDFKKRGTYLWVLDFDKTRRIQYDSTCIPLLLGGVTANDPYLPNPKHSPKPLYYLFKKTYLEASDIILRRNRPTKDVLALPQQFLRAWEDWSKEPEDIGFELDGWGDNGDDGDDEDEDEDDDFSEEEISSEDERSDAETGDQEAFDDSDDEGSD